MKLLVLALAACTSHHAPPDATAPAAATGMLYARSVGPQTGPFPVGDIFLRDGTTETRLTTTGDSAFAAWSLDGSQIAFTRYIAGTSEIWTMRPDGSEPTRVTTGVAGKLAVMPSWSPDGGIVFTFDHAAVLVDPATGMQQTLRDNAMFASFARDGAKLVYTTKVLGTDRVHNEIFTMAADGTNPVQITFSDDPDAPDANASSFSPDGKTIAFFCGFEGDLPADQLDQYYRAGKQQVCLIGADGTNRRTLTHCTMCGSDNPGWSPDGTQVFFDRGTFTAGVVTNAIGVDGANDHALLDVSYGGGRLPWLAGGGA